MASGRVLIIEDEPMIQLLLEDICDIAGFEVVGIASTVKEASVQVADGSFDVAILDVNLHGENSEDVASTLCEKRIPVIVTSGSHAKELSSPFHNFTIVQKPFGTKDIVELLQEAICDVTK